MSANLGVSLIELSHHQSSDIKKCGIFRKSLLHGKYAVIHDILTDKTVDLQQ